MPEYQAGKPAPPEVANRGGNAGVQATDNTAGSSFVAGEGPANSCIEGSEEFGEAEEARDDSIGSKLPSGAFTSFVSTGIRDLCSVPQAREKEPPLTLLW
eukprot:1158167-Pelagomonas_calceolata.AAC.2